jgi:hypothetical protein
MKGKEKVMASTSDEEGPVEEGKGDDEEEADVDKDEEEEDKDKGDGEDDEEEEEEEDEEEEGTADEKESEQEDSSRVPTSSQKPKGATGKTSKGKEVASEPSSQRRPKPRPIMRIPRSKTPEGGPEGVATDMDMAIDQPEGAVAAREEGRHSHLLAIRSNSTL